MNPLGLSQRLKTAPATTPVSLSEVKEWLRIDHSAEDTSLTNLIKAATKRAEELTNLKFISQTWSIYFDAFPESNILDLRMGRLISVTHVKSYDESNVATTFGATNYIAETSGAHGAIALKTGALWPVTILKPKGGVEIEAIFGFGANASDVPEDIRTAILEICVALYDGRGNEEIKPLPASASALLGPYRVAP